MKKMNRINTAGPSLIEDVSNNLGFVSFVSFAGLLLFWYVIVNGISPNLPEDRLTKDFNDLRFAIHQVAPSGDYSQISNKTLIKFHFVPAEILVKDHAFVGPREWEFWHSKGTFTISGTDKVATIAFSPVSKALCIATVYRLFGYSMTSFDSYWDTINGINTSVAQREESDQYGFAEAACHQNKIIVTMK